jgi:multiple sugar transport system substrate-binding protein
VSFGSPQFCLLFRRDWFERLQITPPTTWAAYQEVVARLADRKQVADLLPAEGQPWTPVIEPLGSGWRGQVLLARSAAYAQHRSQFSTLFDYRTMTPLIDGPPFVRALQELVETARHGPANAQQLGPAQVRREFLEGRAAMVLTWPSRADDQSGEGAPVAAAFAELPGSVEAYNFRTQSWDKRGDASDQRVTLAAMAGRLGSVTRESSEPLVAGNMLIWLTGRLSADVCTETEAGTLFRESHLPLVGRWIDRQFDEAAAKSYGEAVQQAQNRTAWLASVRIPGRPRYLAALDDAVAEALSGVPPADCLRKTAAEWDKITDAIGRESQRQAYMQSVGINP